MIVLLQRFADVELLERFVRGVVTARYHGEEAGALTESTRILGAKRCGALFSRLIKGRMRVAPSGCINLFARLVDQHRGPIPSGLGSGTARNRHSRRRKTACLAQRLRVCESVRGSHTGAETH